MMRNLFNTNKKSILSLLLALAMVFSFVGLSSPVLAGPDAQGTPTTQVELNIYNADDTLYDTATITEATHGSASVLRDYSILKKKAGSTPEYFTGLGVSLKDVIEAKLPAGKTVNDIAIVDVICNEVGGDTIFTFDSTTEYTVESLFDGSRKYYPAVGTESVVEASLNFKSSNYITNDVNDTNLTTVSAIRLHIGQTSSNEANMPRNLKWVKGIDVVLK